MQLITERQCHAHGKKIAYGIRYGSFRALYIRFIFSQTCSSNQNNSNQFKMDHPTFLWAPPVGSNNLSTAQMFSTAFDRLFTNFNVMVSFSMRCAQKSRAISNYELWVVDRVLQGSNNNLEETLSLWLLLVNKNNAEHDSFSNVVPLIPISVNTISDVMTAASR